MYSSASHSLPQPLVRVPDFLGARCFVWVGSAARRLDEPTMRAEEAVCSRDFAATCDFALRSLR